MWRNTFSSKWLLVKSGVKVKRAGSKFCFSDRSDKGKDKVIKFINLCWQEVVHSFVGN